ncbi:TIR domain-containing protein [Brevibacillus sp. LEMMJ03]|uniref:TIR domain-containing protein n=1 Tax=Brevibacillus sp. LEMMJ03 TaxID=2595056 RepID=UPI001C8F595A|nr:TIR domain-containing protein [Brevibacillus sp. LEMMJ03]
MKYAVEDIYRTEGVPQYTFVKPPNYNDILVDIRNPGKPVILEGQSGTGKTTTVKKIMENHLPTSGFEYLSARKASDVTKINSISEGKLSGKYVIDDFHRLSNDIQGKLADIIKIAAEEPEDAGLPKLVILGINKVGSELIQLVPDIAKRCGIHKILPASKDTIFELIALGEERLNIVISDKETIFTESKGDYWLTQLLCQTICLMNETIETLEEKRELSFRLEDLRRRVINRLESSYGDAVKEFCRGKRFRPTNDPYYRLLKCVSEQDSAIVDLKELADNFPEVSGSINNIKEKRLKVLLDTKPICERYFYYNSDTKNFAIEDPALFYYIKHLDWEALRKVCGFKNQEKQYDFDFALSFAGENRTLAKEITQRLISNDCSVFFDELFEANYLGATWSSTFAEIFKDKSKYVVCLLDVYHKEKIWPTFERECFVPRVKDGAVIPIYLDDTPFVGIPQDIVGIDLKGKDTTQDDTINEIIDKLIQRIS